MNSDNPLKVIVVNCQSVQAKKSSLVSLVSQYTPDIIVGTESWLTPAVNSSEIFPSNYNIYRHDRPDGYGRVFLACKSNLISEELPLSTTCELVACKIHLAHHYLIVCSLYRPPDRNFPYLEELCMALKQVTLTNPNAIIWFAGDLNLPNINWNLNCLQGNNYPSTLCMELLDTLLELGLSQIVTFPTRYQNTLDIFITNRPT